MTVGAHLALTHSLRFGAYSSPGSQFVVTTDTTYGDTSLILYSQLAVNASADGFPASVVPAGYTITGANVAANLPSTDKATLQTACYKIMTASDRGTGPICMFGQKKSRIAGIILNFNRRIRTVSVVNYGVSLSGGIPSGFTINDDGVRAPGHLYILFAHGDASVPDSGVTMDGSSVPFGSSQNTPSGYVSNCGYGSPSQTRVLYNFYPYNGSIMDSGNNFGLDNAMAFVKTADSGDFNAVSGLLLHLT